MEERAFHPLDYVSVLRRRKWWFIVPLVVCVVTGALLAVLLPKTYLSAAEIGVASPTLSPELLRGVQSLDKEERQRAISQQLLSRNVLERVVREERMNPAEPVEQTAGWLRRRVVIDVAKPLAGGGENKNGLDSFKLGYMDSTPEQTQRITNRLAYVFVEENSKTRTQQAENTSEVLAQQVKASQERLAQIEDQLRNKKEANMGRLPEQINTNVQMVNGLRQQLDSISIQLRGEQDRLSMIESQLDAMRQGAAGGGLTSSGAASIQSSRARINQLQHQLAAERAIGKTDKHPDVVALKEEIANARAELGSAKKTDDGGRDDLLQADPMYRQRTLDRDNARLRIRTLQAAEAQARAQIGQYQRRVEAAPMVEQDLSSVQREYDLEKIRYADLKKKHDEAVNAEDLARKQGGERFSVLYPAYLPVSPATPNQPRLLLLALALGLALGAGLVVAREFMDRSVHDAQALQSEFEIPVLGEIPRIHRAA